MSLVVVGSVAFDDLETPSGRRERVLGGSASYFSLCASQFHPVQVVAVVGEDFGSEEEQVFQGRPIDLKGLVKKPGLSFRWKGFYGQDLNEANTLETHLNVFQDFDPDLPTDYRQASYLFLGNIDPVLQMKVVEQMVHQPDWIALDTMNFWINGPDASSRAALMKVLRKVDILLVNDAELKSLAGEKNLLRASRIVRDMGPRILVVKRGEFGVALFAPEGMFMAPAFPLERVDDPTGAGDTFAGGFLGYLAAHGSLDMETLKRAAVNGSVLASFTVERFGTERLQSLKKEEIHQRIKAFWDMIRVEAL